MRALWTNVQAALFGVVSAVLTVVGDSTLIVFAASTSLVAVLTFFAVNLHYSHQLAGRPRSSRRAREDRAVSIGLSLLTIGSLVAYATKLVANPSTGISLASVGGFSLAALSVGFASIYVSSLVDRYVILPWRDGTLGSLPFTSARSKRETMTRVWLWHRIVCTALFFAGLWAACGLAYFSATQATKSMDWAVFLIGLFSPSVIPALFMKDWLTGLPTATNLAFGHLEVFVGDYIVRRDGARVDSGVVMEVSVDKAIQVVPDQGRPWTLPLSEARENQYVSVEDLPNTVDWQQVVGSVRQIRAEDMIVKKIVRTPHHLVL